MGTKFLIFNGFVGSSVFLVVWFDWQGLISNLFCEGTGCIFLALLFVAILLLVVPTVVGLIGLLFSKDKQFSDLGAAYIVSFLTMALVLGVLAYSNKISEHRGSGNVIPSDKLFDHSLDEFRDSAADKKWFGTREECEQTTKRACVFTRCKPTIGLTFREACEKDAKEADLSEADIRKGNFVKGWYAK